MQLSQLPINIKPNQENLESLENKFKIHCFKDIDIQNNCGFKDFLFPNESYPENLKPHLDLGEKGIIVSTGTERSFFDLLFSNSEKCEGVIVVDINPKAKAYVDFNVMLLRISKNRNEYFELSATVPNNISIKNRTDKILEKIIESDLPVNLQEYYSKNLQDFGSVYLKIKRIWADNLNKGDRFISCQYGLNDCQFSKLQNYAKSGNIIATIGSINELEFIQDRNVSIVDISNIHEYVMIALKGNENFNPRVILTDPCPFSKAKYFSHSYSPLSKNERLEFDQLIDKMYNTSLPWILEFINDLGMQDLRCHQSHDEFNYDTKGVYSKNALKEVKKLFSESYIDIPGIGFLNLNSRRDIERLNDLTSSQLKDVAEDKKITMFLNSFVFLWSFMKAETFLAFSQLEGWKEKFEEHFSSNEYYLEGLLKKLKEADCLNQFILEFGQERLNSVKDKVELIHKERISAESRFWEEMVEKAREFSPDFAKEIIEMHRNTNPNFMI
ncbi:MAG: hypothetical protein H0T62_08470 [Parachlamydiaceae bacterium]|nr:hypothetical protein [Parachlamydiaceae bacterium]